MRACLFPDRSDINAKDKLPAEVQKGGFDNDLEELDTYVAKTTDADSAQLIVFSAPNSKVLVGLGGIYPNAESIPEEPAKDKCIELRFIKNIALVVQGSELDQATREKLHDIISSTLHDDVNLQVDVRTKIYEDLPAGASVESIIHYVKETYGLNYACVFKVIEFEAKPGYDAQETPPSPSVQRFTELPPTETAYAKPIDFRKALDDFERRKRVQDDIYFNTECSWEHHVFEVFDAHVRVQMQILRVTDSKPIWVKEFDIPYQPDKIGLRSEKKVLHGYDKRPEWSPLPDQLPAIPADIKFNAVKAATHHACIVLQGTARPLQEGEAPKQDPAIAKLTLPTNPVKYAIGDSPSGVRGDGDSVAKTMTDTQQVLIQLSAKNAQLKAGRIGKVYASTDASAPVVLRVKVDKIIPGQPPKAVCSPVLDADAAKINQLKADAPVEWEPQTVPGKQQPKKKPQAH